MSEATAKLTLDASKATQGAKQFQAAARIIFDADKKMKEQVEKPAKGAEKNIQKVKTDLNGLAGEFGRVTSASGALDLALSKIGTSLKIAGPVALVAAIGKGIYDATQNAKQFDDLLKRIQKSNSGGATNFSASELESNLSTIREARSKNREVIDGMTNNIASAYWENIKTMMARTGGDIYKFMSGNDLDVMSPIEREDVLRRAEEAALDRISQKQSQIFEIEKERLEGNKNRAEILSIEAEYAERIQRALSERRFAFHKQLVGERDALLAAAGARHKIELYERTSAEASAAMRAGDARRAVGMTSEDEQRQARHSALAEAIWQADDARRAANYFPENQDLETRARIAESNLLRVRSENEKAERDIARAKKDSLDIAIAENQAMEQSMRGMQTKAELTRQIAQLQQQIVAAERAGHKEIVNQLNAKSQLLQRQAAIAALTGEDGRIMPMGRFRAQQRAQQRAADRRMRRIEGLEDNAGLTNVRRDTRGRIIDGIDPLTGERKKPDPSHPNAAPPTLGDTAQDYFNRRLKDNAPRAHGVSWQNQEMDSKQATAQRAAESSKKQSEYIDSKMQGSGDPAQTSLSKIERILSSWDQEE